MRKITFILLFLIALIAEGKTAQNHFEKLYIEQDTDTLNILISSAGGVYYYTSPLAEDASNFKSIFAKDINLIAQEAQQVAEKRNHSLVVLLKSEPSKKAADIARWYPNYSRGKLTELEKQLIKLTERGKSSKN